MLKLLTYFFSEEHAFGARNIYVSGCQIRWQYSKDLFKFQDSENLYAVGSMSVVFYLYTVDVSLFHGRCRF
jgi:hypothetical protein